MNEEEELHFGEPRGVLKNENCHFGKRKKLRIIILLAEMVLRCVYCRM